MTVLEIKGQISRLKSRDLKELHIHLVRLRQNTLEWKKAAARKIRAVQAGRFISAEEIEERLSRG
jgi:hypothetical protein